MRGRGREGDGLPISNRRFEVAHSDRTSGFSASREFCWFDNRTTSIICFGSSEHRGYSDRAISARSMKSGIRSPSRSGEGPGPWDDSNSIDRATTSRAFRDWLRRRPWRRVNPPYGLQRAMALCGPSHSVRPPDKPPWGGARRVVQSDSKSQVSNTKSAV